MEASSVLAEDGAPPPPPPPLPLPPPNENGNDAGAGGAAVESGNRDGLVEVFSHRVDDLTSKADELEQKVNEIVQFYARKMPSNNWKGSSVMKDKEKEKAFGINNHINMVNNSGRNSNAKKQVDGRRKEVVRSITMQELMRRFGTILKQITQHKWAWPFMKPVQVEALGLHDYYEVIKKPMDFSTIKNQMEAKDGCRYKNVREIYADVILVFTNAMTYNDEGSHVHVMAKTLLEIFEKKWLQLLPKVVQEEKIRKEEAAAQALANMQIAQEAVFAKMARETSNGLDELNLHLEELKESVIQRCRKMSADEKRKLCMGLRFLSPEYLDEALDIIAQHDPSFQATAEEVDFDMDAQSESTLWKLKFFVKSALELQAKNSASKVDDNSKRKKEICDAPAKTAKKRKKKLSS
ncbi:transcription factor GTE1 isoform X2 [Elaeis guineensis]|uniref:transcription factor GTE6 n=1 Tax=Elaeis guineensis var. tenera TaxID=51953 RepID=A0A6I9QPC1_ELAGV|nr:transcription factor GTE6 [Elaeis guineensis]XP_010912650.1 transcription factor GTE6 [Elaeis guineensis]XP_019703491.1 transcription factor GTE6 [Elaeis guineensis]